MVLLTSSQVSVAISAAIIITFTTALFLSGYVLQQHTLNDLREAIKPQLVPTPPELQFNLPEQFRQEGRGLVDVEAEMVDSMVGATRWQKESARRKQLEAERAVEEQKAKLESAEGSEEVEEKLSAAERRKRIKEEILLTGEGEGFKGYKRRMW